MQAHANFTKSIHICIFLNFKEDKLITSTELAHSLKTNPVVVRRLIALLKKHQIIGSIAGAHGGFFLERASDKITLWDIYLAVRDENFFNRPKINPDCVVSSNLAVLVHDTFSEAEMSMKKILDKTSISTLTKDLQNILGEKEAAEAIDKGS